VVCGRGGGGAGAAGCAAAAAGGGHGQRWRGCYHTLQVNVLPAVSHVWLRHRVQTCHAGQGWQAKQPVSFKQLLTSASFCTRSFGELYSALAAMEADGEDAPVLLHESPDGITVHFTF
jgi:hypothetical protein